MSIFGELDAASIPTNPFFVEKGDYTAEVTKSEYKTNRDGQRQLHIEYTINDEDSEYLDSKVPQYFNLVDANMTMESFALLPAEERKIIKRNNANLKRTLCGDDGDSTKRGLGVTVDDLNDKNWNPAILIGTKVNLSVNNFGSSGQSVGVRWVNTIQE